MTVGDASNGGYLPACFGAKVAALVIGHLGAVLDQAAMDDFLTLNKSD
jgi:hypothetical protein